MDDLQIEQLLSNTLVDPEMFSEDTRTILLETKFVEATDEQVILLDKNTLVAVITELLLNYLRRTSNIFQSAELRRFFSNPKNLNCEKHIKQMLTGRNRTMLRLIFVILMKDLWSTRRLPVLILKHFPDIQDLELSEPNILNLLLENKDINFKNLEKELFSFLRMRKMYHNKLKKKNKRILRQQLVNLPEGKKYKMSTLFEQFKLKCKLDLARSQRKDVSFEAILKHVYAMADPEFFPFVQKIYVKYMNTTTPLLPTVENDIRRIYKMMKSGPSIESIEEEEDEEEAENNKKTLDNTLQSCNELTQPAPVFENKSNSCYLHMAFQMIYRMRDYVKTLSNSIREGRSQAEFLDPNEKTAVLLSTLLLCFMGETDHVIVKTGMIIPGAIQINDDNRVEKMNFVDVLQKITSVAFSNDRPGIQQDISDAIRQIMTRFNKQGGLPANKYVQTVQVSKTYDTNLLHKGLIYKTTRLSDAGRILEIKNHKIPQKAIKSYENKWKQITPSISTLRFNPDTKTFKLSKTENKDFVIKIKQSVFKHTRSTYTISTPTLYFTNSDKKDINLSETEVLKAAELWNKDVQFPDSSYFVYCVKEKEIYYRLSRKADLRTKFGLKTDLGFRQDDGKECHPISTDVTDVRIDEKIVREEIKYIDPRFENDLTTLLRLPIPPFKTVNTNRLLEFWQNEEIPDFKELAQTFGRQNPFKRLRITTKKYYFISKYLVVKLLIFNDHGQKLTGRNWDIDENPVKFGFNFTEKNNINPDSPCELKLVGVSIHIGETINGGHYVGYVKSFGDDQWYYYDDIQQKRIRENPGSYIGTGVPAVLLYKNLSFV
jgi:hypothetical protein